MWLISQVAEDMRHIALWQKVINLRKITSYVEYQQWIRMLSVSITKMLILFANYLSNKNGYEPIDLIKVNNGNDDATNDDDDEDKNNNNNDKQ